MSGEQPNDLWGPFIPGLALNRRYYQEAVGPLLQGGFPGLPHAAGLLGFGSDVLGFDTPMSRDHMWGPRLVLFLEGREHAATAARIDDYLRNRLPLRFSGYPTHFGAPDAEGVRKMQAVDQGPVDHLITITTIARFVQGELGIEPDDSLEPADWLSFPQQKLLALTAGGVFHDDLGLEAVRQRFRSYPHDIWLYLLASQWERIGQEEAFVGRAGQAGDELGSRVIASRLVHDLMRLAFLLERRYAPYSKWFGSAFKRLEIAASLGPLLEAVLAAGSWQPREANLARAYELLGERQNAAGIASALDAHTRSFYDRPFRVLFAGRFASALRDKISDPALRSLPLFGSVDQISTNTNLLEDPQALRRMKEIYRQVD